MDYTLDRILQPCTPETFVADYYGKQLLYVPGDRSKFDQLLSWESLNSILQRQGQHGQASVYKGGRFIPFAAYMQPSQMASTRGSPGAGPRFITPRYSSSAITQELREGATLVINDVNEMHQPVTRLANALEFKFHAKTTANLYAAWREVRGFDVHKDDHDVFVMQISGRKKWEVYGRAEEYAPGGPVDAPQWEKCLQPGDLLYLPRGWWHAATPVGEPTLHLTVGVFKPIGRAIVSWLMEKLEREDFIRSEIPIFSPKSTQDEYAERVRTAIMSVLSSVNVVREFQRYWRRELGQPPTFALPWSATQNRVPPGESWQVRLVRRDFAIEVLERPNEAAEVLTPIQNDVVFGDGRYILTHLVDKGLVPMVDVYRHCSSKMTQERVQNALADIASLGVIVFERIADIPVAST